jgi:hypothetical protein
MGVLPALLVAASTLAFRRYDEEGTTRVPTTDPQESLP